MNGEYFRLPGVTASGPIARIVRVCRRCRPPSSRKGPLFPLESTRRRGPVSGVYLPATPISRFLAPDESGANPRKQNTAPLANCRKLLATYARWPLVGASGFRPYDVSFLRCLALKLFYLLGFRNS